MKNALTDPAEPNSGHGHVYPRPDRAKARCGGPGKCQQCTQDAVRKQAQQELPTPVSHPVVLVPENYAGTEAEAIALAVVGAVTSITRQRDQLRAALAALVDAFPETSWAADAHALERARAVLEEVPEAPSPGTQGSTMAGHPQT